MSKPKAPGSADCLSVGLINRWPDPRSVFQWIGYLHAKVKRRTHPQIRTWREWPLSSVPVAIELP